MSFIGGHLPELLVVVVVLVGVAWVALTLMRRVHDSWHRK